jgi:hypothetical protein
MKAANTIIIIILLCFCYACRKVSKPTLWYPLKYIKAIETNDTVNIKSTLIPIIGFIDFNDTLYFITYGGEPAPVFVKETLVNGKKISQILNVKYYLSLNYFSMDSINRYASAKFYLARNKNTLELRMIEGEKSKIFLFIRNYRSDKLSNLLYLERYFKGF